MTAPLDIDRLMAQLANMATLPASTPAPPLRDAPQRPSRTNGQLRYATVTDHEPVQVGAWLDGVQHQRTLAMVHHRPIIGQYVAVAAIDADFNPLQTRTTVRVVCSEVDAERLREAIGSEYIITVADGDETVIATGATSLIKQTRHDLEREVSHEVVKMVDELVVVDGPLTGHPQQAHVAGVVKSHPCAYLTPEVHLHNLHGEQATDPPFEILTEAGDPTDRHATYLRLHDHSKTGVLHGLVRLETRDPTLNLALAATCLRHRQWSARDDRRWSVHLEPIAWAESVARARLPASWR